MLVVELGFLWIGWWHNSKEYFLDMLDIDEMGQDVCFFEESYKWNCTHFFILKLHLSLSEKQSVLPLEAPVVFLDIDEMDVLELILIVGKCLDGVLH